MAFNVKTWERVFYRVGVGEVTPGKEYDFSYEVKHLGYTESVGFAAVYEGARAAVRVDEAVAAFRKMWELRKDDEARRVEVMRKAKEAGVEPDPAELELSTDLSSAFMQLHRAKAEAEKAFLDKLPKEWLGEIFSSYVRNVEGLQIDGQDATAGADLIGIADNDLTQAVLTRIHLWASLTTAEGKASPSPSTSPQGETEPSPVPGG